MHPTRSIRVVLALTLGLLLLPACPQQACASSTLYVDDDGDNGGAGTEASPWRTIEWAINNASAGDTIKVLPGTYAYEPAGEQDFPISLPPGVRLMSTGGSSVTTIEGNPTQPVIVISEPTAGTEVRGFTITNGNAANGAGMQITRTGGGSLPGWPVVAANRIFENDASNRGGGIHLEGTIGAVCEPLIQDNEISYNSAPGGAGIACSDYASPVIRGNYIHNNTLGEGILVVGHSEATIAKNSLRTNGGRGIHASPDASYEIRIVGNDIGGNQGGLSLSSGTYVVEGNRVTGNGAVGEGGGLDVWGSSVDCSNNLWASNFAGGDGGAGYVRQGSITYNGDTFYGNTSIGWPGVYAEDELNNEGSITLRNSILWGHASGQDAYGTTISYCDTEDADLEADGNAVGLGMIHADPRFVPGTDYLLQSDSPCIDTGDPKGYPADDFYSTSRPQLGDGSAPARPDMGYYEYPEPIVQQFAGSDRYDTAVRIVREWFDEADTVVLASGEDFPDALSASGLAGTLHAPLLLTRRDSVPSVVSDVLSDLGATEIILVGGTAAISQVVASELSSDYSVRRISGIDRYATAAAVAREVARLERSAGAYDGWAFIARGDEFPDALALAPISYTMGHEHEGGPILLTRPGTLPESTADALRDLDVRAAYIAGGVGAVSVQVETSINSMLASNDPLSWEAGRWGGADRFETAAEVAGGGIAVAAEDCSYVGVATGHNFPDALAGAAAAGRRYQGIVLLTRTGSLPDATRDWLSANKSRLQWAEVYGGEGAVSAEVKAAMSAALGW